MRQHWNVLMLATGFILNMAGASYLQAQQYDFEILMNTDHDEVPGVFRLDDQGNFIGLVRKAPPTDSSYVYNTFLYKIDPRGDTTSIKFTKEDTVFSFYYIDKLLTEPAGFLLTGWGYKMGGDPNHPFTIMRRITNELELVWEKKFFFNDYFFEAYRSSVTERQDGNILYACSNQINYYLFILKLSAEGDSLDFVSYSGNEAGEVFGFTPSPDSAKVWLHNWMAHYQGVGSYVSSCIVLDSKMDQVGVKHYPEFLFPPFNAILYNDSTLLCGGSERIPDPNTGNIDKQICAYLLDTAFNVMHEVHLTDPDTNSRAADCQGIDYYYPDCIYLGGTHHLQYLIGQQPSWFYITKLNDTLGIEYEKYIGGDDYYWLYSVTAAADGGVLLAGTRQEVALTLFQRDALLIKLDSTGCLTTMPEESDLQITEAILYPNPGSSSIHIRTALHGCHFKLYDARGLLILSKKLQERISTIHTDYLNTGTYFYTVTSNNKTITSGSWMKY